MSKKKQMQDIVSLAQGVDPSKYSAASSSKTSTSSESQQSSASSGSSAHTGGANNVSSNETKKVQNIVSLAQNVDPNKYASTVSYTPKNQHPSSGLGTNAVVGGTSSVAERIKAAREANEEKNGGLLDKLSAAASEMFGGIADRNMQQQKTINSISDRLGKPSAIDTRDNHVRQNYMQHEINSSADSINKLFGDTSNVDYSKRMYLTGADM